MATATAPCTYAHMRRRIVAELDDFNQESLLKFQRDTEDKGEGGILRTADAYLCLPIPGHIPAGASDTRFSFMRIYLRSDGDQPSVCFEWRDAAVRIATPRFIEFRGKRIPRKGFDVSYPIYDSIADLMGAFMAQVEKERAEA